MSMNPEDKMKFDAVFISDLHLGNRFVDTALLKQFLEAIKTRTARLYLVGDIFDSWRHCQPAEFIEMFTGFQQIIYVRGNHDGAFAEAKNPLPGQAIDGQNLIWNNKPGMITHAHFFDRHFNKDSWWAGVTDALIYKFSRLIDCDLKAKLGRIGENYSNEIESSCSQIGKLFALDFMVIGHTHYGGERLVNGVRLFNLGSWLTTPYALFQSGDQYCFSSVSKDVLIPEERLFKLF